MELSKNYTPGQIEDKWYQHWLNKGYFNSYPDERQPFTIVIPPPNVTGVLHMGHTLNETVQDILVRKARMSGFNACWVPGSDHASIATEARVVSKLKEMGIEKRQLTRGEFMNYAYEWKEKYGGIIYGQIAKLGCSVDWNRISFTMDPKYYEAVITVFVELYKKELIYRGARMVHWDPVARTALSDEEVEYKEITGKLYYIKYRIVNEDGSIYSSSHLNDDSLPIATQRPETIMGDVAVCVNPDDERWFDLKGKFVIVPLVNRRVPIIFDSYVDLEFGTGVLKITPAHDINDYNIGIKHNLPAIDTLNEDGTLSAAAGVFVGIDRFEARKKAVAQLKSEGLLIKEEDYQTRLGYSQRTGAVVEPKISTQWFVRMPALAGPALKEVLNGNIRIHPPEKFLATYKYWLENVEDWCISRQLWWGQRIPAWYAPDGSYVVAENKQEAFEQFRNQAPLTFSIEDLKQDEDVLDTWFSSWLWPIEVFKGISQPGNQDIEYYYPGSVLVTGQDIIFFWVARMIMAGMEFMNKRPFSDVYFTGMVRDKEGRKMSKSLGNSPDLLELIEKYGADAVRFGILISSPAGNDLLFDEAALEQGRNFNNKIWNALKLVKVVWKLPEVDPSETDSIQNGLGHHELSQSSQPATASFAVKWFGNQLSLTKIEINKLYQDFRLSEALKIIYSLIWDDFCSWYLEWIKPEYGQQIDSATIQSTINFFEELMHLLHPFMPFITEEIYHLLKAREEGNDICVKQYPTLNINLDKEILSAGELAKTGITTIRDLRSKLNLKSKDIIFPKIKTEKPEGYKAIEHLILKMTNAGSIEYINQSIPQTIGATSGSDMFYLPVPISAEDSAISKKFLGEQRRKLEEELEHLKKFLETVQKKLSNERFVQNAKPDILALEKRKKKDAETKIQALEESLSIL